jgi:ABC-2 type transport system ATP-binding protein
MINVELLEKRYGPVTALDSISFEVPKGQVLGFLGPNGAGKTTTMKILTGFLKPDGGRATVAGLDVVTDSLEVRRRIGYLPESTPLYAEMRVDDYLSFAADIRGVPRSEKRAKMNRVIDACGLSMVVKKNIVELSKGYRQRLGLAQAMVHDPELLILDEPTSGLDPLLQHVFQAVLRRAVADGATVFLSSHVLPEVEALADRVGILREGRLVAVAGIDELQAQARQRIDFHVAPPADPAVFAGIPEVVSAEAVDGVIRVVVEGSVERVVRAAAALEVHRLVTHDTDLEDVFLRYYQGDRA